MTLSEFLKSSSTSHADFAAMIGVSQVAVTRYANGVREPNFEILRKIAEATGGRVTANDFVAPPVAQPDEARP
jgi:transcriptional regulator with XRE-family HTH domain